MVRTWTRRVAALDPHSPRIMSQTNIDELARRIYMTEKQLRKAKQAPGHGSTKPFVKGLQQELESLQSSQQEPKPSQQEPEPSRQEPEPSQQQPEIDTWKGMSPGLTRRDGLSLSL